MSQLKKITAEKATDITQHYEMEEEAADQLNKNTSMVPYDFITLLLRQELYSEAVKFLAHALPKRRSVWWASLCARTAPEEQTNTQALIAVQRWVQEPNEEHRKNCFNLAEMDQLKSSASWAALAAFWSSGSIADDSIAQIPPPPFQYALAVTAAVNLAAAAHPSVNDAFKMLLQEGLDIANGRKE